MRDLQSLLRNLDPRLHDDRYRFEPCDGTILNPGVFALIAEDEGVSCVRVARDGEWARISLGVHSSLAAIGLTAVLTERLAAAGISANVIAGLRHDHFFVPWERKDAALESLKGAGTSQV